jgi:hypothetical protein
MASNPIELAYNAYRLVPSYLFQTNELKKKYNPVVTTPALCQAMLHRGTTAFPLVEAKSAALELADDNRGRNRYIRPGKEWKQIVARIETWKELLSLLDSMSVFLKARAPGKKEVGMREFKHQENQLLSSRELSEIARGLVDDIADNRKVNSNKLQQMAAHVTAAQNKWEALVALARFYPRNGIPKPYVNALVQRLETTALRSFKQVVAQSLIFYKAKQVKEEV